MDLPLAILSMLVACCLMPSPLVVFADDEEASKEAPAVNGGVKPKPMGPPGCYPNEGTKCWIGSDIPCCNGLFCAPVGYPVRPGMDGLCLPHNSCIRNGAECMVRGSYCCEGYACVADNGQQRPGNRGHCKRYTVG